MADLTRIAGRPILSRSVTAEVLAADVPLSFWGGFDPDRGEIIDQRHPLAGEIATGRALVIPYGRGSCSGSGVLLEAIQNGTAPAAIITSHLDPIISLGAILGDELFGAFPAILVITEEERQRLETGDLVEVANDGALTVIRQHRTGEDPGALPGTPSRGSPSPCAQGEGLG
jgi:predicted aconitase with swiveling domain